MGENPIDFDRCIGIGRAVEGMEGVAGVVVIVNGLVGIRPACFEDGLNGRVVHAAVQVAGLKIKGDSRGVAFEDQADLVLAGGLADVIEVGIYQGEIPARSVRRSQFGHTRSTAVFQAREPVM